MGIEPRVIVWFSCGEASACALKMAVQKYGKRVIPVYCNVFANESPDNGRFLNDVERWTGTIVKFIGSSAYKTVDEVIDARKYLSGIKGAPCTVELKKIPRFQFQFADDIHIFGFTNDEQDRIKLFEASNPDMILDWILRDNVVTRKACRLMVQSAGIERPLRYRQGFTNNNCICCVKASSIKYWRLERLLNPEVFKRRAEQSRKYGARLTRLKGKRIFLDEIPPEDEMAILTKSTEKISCGPECGGEK